MAWYQKHLGINIADDFSGSIFKWREQDDPEQLASTTWAVFPQDTSYFGDEKNAFMINFRVPDLDAILEELREAGIEVDEHIEEHEYGRFGWITDPEGNRIELWQPAAGQ